jgi:glycosyltransferase involved in cell wall biosynthesis
MKISVCIPVYNVDPVFLKATLDSVLAQEGPFACEVILCDDGSQVEYQPLFNSYPPGTLIYLRNETNLGMVGNWNHAIRQASGTLAMILGHDDLLAPGMFAAYVQVFQTHPDVVLCGGGRQFIDAAGRVITPWRAVNDRANIYRYRDCYLMDQTEVIQLCLRNGNAIGEPSAVLFRREVFLKTGGYDPQFRHAADLDLILRMAAHGNVAYLRQPYLQRRLHAENLTRYNLASGQVSRDRVQLFERFARQVPLSRRDRARSRAYLVLAALYDLLRSWRSSQPDTARFARKTLLRYLRLTPLVYLQSGYELLFRRNLDVR